MGATEMILSSAISGVAYAFLSGQPLCVLGATGASTRPPVRENVGSVSLLRESKGFFANPHQTSRPRLTIVHPRAGPELAYTVVFYNMCQKFNVEFLPARVWQGLWTALFTCMLSVFDASALMNRVTRFTEEIFAALISVIFIIEALTSVVKLYTEPPGGGGDDDDTSGGASRMASAFLGTMLCFGTYGTAMALRSVKRAGKMFNRSVRNAMGDYGVTIAILAFTGVAIALKRYCDTSVPTLAIPSKFAPTWINPKTGEPRAWLVSPLGINEDFPPWAIFGTIIPALGLTFLGYMDQNLTSILINRKDHALRKPPAYHLDLLVCGAVVYPVCAMLGLPFTHAATVRSMTHLVSLTEYKAVPVDVTTGGKTLEESKGFAAARRARSLSMCGEPSVAAAAKTTAKEGFEDASGDKSGSIEMKTVAVGVCEQRVTQLLIHALIACSLAISPALRVVPKSVLSGVFLYMGVTSTAGNQLFDRLHLLLFVWCEENRPRGLPFMRPSRSHESLPMRRVHAFTCVQVALMGGLYAMTKVGAVAVAFPFFIGALVFVREWALPSMFTSDELDALDA